MNAQDFKRDAGLDFTGINPITAADLNNLIDLSLPGVDRGLVLISTDTALNTPDTPNASTTTKWARYIWVRIPFNAAPDQKPKIYAWSPTTANSDTALLNWHQLVYDDTTIVADVAANTAELVDHETRIGDAETKLGNQSSDITASTNLANQALSGLPQKKIEDNIAIPGITGTASFTTTLPSRPQYVRWVLKCTTNDAGRVIGDEVDIDSVLSVADSSKVFYPFYNASNNTHNISFLNAANYFATPKPFKVPVGPIFVAITTNSWVLRCYTIYFP